MKKSEVLKNNKFIIKINTIFFFFFDRSLILIVAVILVYCCVSIDWFVRSMRGRRIEAKKKYEQQMKLTQA